jgi:hypothetical protein
MILFVGLVPEQMNIYLRALLYPPLLLLLLLGTPIGILDLVSFFINLFSLISAKFLIAFTYGNNSLQTIRQLFHFGGQFACIELSGYSLIFHINILRAPWLGWRQECRIILSGENFLGDLIDL